MLYVSVRTSRLTLLKRKRSSISKARVDVMVFVDGELWSVCCEKLSILKVSNNIEIIRYLCVKRVFSFSLSPHHHLLSIHHAIAVR